MVPKGWVATDIDSIANLKSGGTPSKQNSSYWGGPHPWVSAKDLKCHFIEKSIETLSDSGFKIANIAPKNTVLILVRGMTLLNDLPIGITTKEVAFNQDIKALIAKTDVDPLFLSYLFIANKNRLRKIISTAGHGTGRLDTNQLKAFPIHLPPYSEQAKIAQILSTWDKAIEITKKLIENSKAQKKALMQQLLSENDSTSKFHAKQATVKLNELTSVYDGTHSTPHYVKEGVPFYSVEHLTRDDFSDTKFVSNEVYKKENLRVKLEKGDILMTRIGDIGTSKYLDWDVQASFYVSLALIKQGASFDSLFLSYYIQSEAFQRELWKKTIHVAFPKKINLGDLGKCSVSLPPIEEQQKIAKVLSSVDQTIKTQKRKLECLLKEKQSLMQQLLTGKRRVKVGLVKASKAVA
jgi:type I restriction enzyme, S subunit